MLLCFVLCCSLSFIKFVSSWMATREFAGMVRQKWVVEVVGEWLTIYPMVGLVDGGECVCGMSLLTLKAAAPHLKL